MKGKFGAIDPNIFDKILHVNYREYHPSTVRDLKGTIDFAAKLKVAFPEQHFTVEDEISVADKIVFRYTWRSLHKNDFLNWSATGKEVTSQEIIIAKVVSGMIVELWEEWDFAGFLRQMSAKAI